MLPKTAANHRPKLTMMRALALCAVTLVLALCVGGGIASGDGEIPAEGAPSEQRTELPGKRTATSNTFRLPSGELQTALYGAPVNFKDEEGDWKPIDEKLEETNAGIVNGDNSFDLRLPQQIGSGAVRLSEEDQWISYRFLGTPTEAAEVQGSAATYESPSGRFSFELHSLATGLKEAIILNDPSAPGTYRYEMQLAEGLEPKLAEDGSIAIRDQEGSLFATVAAPTIEEAGNGLSGPSDAVHYSLEEAASASWVVAVEADEAWLQSPERSWPITLDPAPALIATETDCTIGSLPAPKGWTACGNSGATELAAGYSQKENQPARTFLRFKLGSWSNPVIPANSYVSKAILKLYAPKPAENTVPGLETRRVTKSWSTKINWEEYDKEFFTGKKWATPGGDFTSEGKAEVLTSQRGPQAGLWEFTSTSLRELAEGWVENNTILGGGIKNQGLVVKQIDETKTAECIANSNNCPRRYVGFNSSAAASNKPELDLTYFPKAPSSNKLLSPSEGTTTGRRLMLKAAWAPGVTGVSFQYRAGKKGPFNRIPSSLLRNGKGEAIEELAVSEKCCQSEPVYFDAAHLNSELQSKAGRSRSARSSKAEPAPDSANRSKPL